MLPSPTALPAAASRTPIFDEKEFSRLFFSCVLFAVVSHNGSEGLKILCGVCGNDSRGVREVKWLTLAIAKNSSGFFQNEGGCREIPWREEVLKVKFASTQCEIAKFWGCRSKTADVVALPECVKNDLGAHVSIFLMINGESGTHDGVFEGTVAHVDLL